MIVHKHCALNVQPEQYSVVKENLLNAVVAVLGDAVAPEIGAAWSEAYDTLAKVLIDAEQACYEKMAGMNGWRGFRTFEVCATNRENDTVVSVTLTPKDPSKMTGCPHLAARVPVYTAGQFVGVRADIGGRPVVQNYTVSCAPNNEFVRLTVRREGGNTNESPAGIMSSHIHALKVGATLDVTSPAGLFRLLDAYLSDKTAAVFFSGGIPSLR